MRPLAAPKEGSQKTKEISRGHKVNISASGLVSIIGGKWTTFRKMGQDVIDRIASKYKKSFPASTSLSLDIEGEAVYSNQDRIHPSLPYSASDIARVIKEEMPMTVEDVLARRTRCLLLDATATEQILPDVAKQLQTHLSQSDEWREAQILSMKELITNYKVN